MTLHAARLPAVNRMASIRSSQPGTTIATSIVSVGARTSGRSGSAAAQIRLVCEAQNLPGDYQEDRVRERVAQKAGMVGQRFWMLRAVVGTDAAGRGGNHRRRAVRD